MKRLVRRFSNVLIALGLVLATALALSVLAGSFFYYEVCPAGIERVGLPIAEWKPSYVPFVWQPPEGCQATNAVRQFLGEVGIMEDATPRVPRIPG